MLHHYHEHWTLSISPFHNIHVLINIQLNVCVVCTKVSFWILFMYIIKYTDILTSSSSSSSSSWIKWNSWFVGTYRRHCFWNCRFINVRFNEYRQFLYILCHKFMFSNQKRQVCLYFKINSIIVCTLYLDFWYHYNIFISGSCNLKPNTYWVEYAHI